MAASIRKFLTCALLSAGLCGAASAAAPKIDKQLPIDFSAQPIDIDYKNHTVVAHKVKITQGNLTLTADQGQVNGSMQTAFDDSRWVFKGAVKVTMDQGVLNSDEAQVTFVDKALIKAVATGKPATFQQKIEKTDRLAKGHAENIEYDVPKNLVLLSKDAWLTDGQNEVKGDSLKYNMTAQTIAAEGSESTNQRVHIIYTPPPKPPSNPQNP